MNLRTLIDGRNGEHKAARYLTKKGYRITEMNFSSPFGEIDIIAQKGDIVAFVEVKLRKNADFAPAYEAVTLKKQERIKKTALLWMARNNCDLQMSFDIIEIYTESGTVNHFENAFC